MTEHNGNLLASDILQQLGGYQTNDRWSDSRFDLTNLTLELLRVNGAPLFDVTLDIDAKNSSRYALIIELPRPTSLMPSLLPLKSKTESMHVSEASLMHLL